MAHNLYAEENVHEPFLSANHVEKDRDHHEAPSSHHSRRSWLYYAIPAICLSSVLLNLWLLVSSSSKLSCPSPRPSFAGLSYDTPITYQHHSPWWGATNMTLADQLWEHLDTDPMVVALDDAYVSAHNLPHSGRWAWDATKGRYFLKVFHQLHCLKYIRRTLVDYQRGRPPITDPLHAHHCLASLRQDVMCLADDTPMPSGDEVAQIGDGQVMMCRDFTALVAWAYDPVRNACHKSLDEYVQIVHPRERYAFCEPGSEYYEKMKAYFDEHGHQDPYQKEPEASGEGKYVV
ncbi:MAG: hypothetical protein M1821_007016 [Bathelium mastoideum]|nr:MAG: hypothetical protein M1821_007016 [Bathelium mastoideum]KAI9683468.1 MAG: hypothetical protein M1822_006008 [Bathelium mastoideum]